MTLLQRDMDRRRVGELTELAGERAAYLDRVCRLLWPAPAEVTLTRSGLQAGDSAKDRPAPSSGEGDPELIVVPGHAEPRLLIPTERRAAAAAVRRYGEPGSLSSRLRKRLVWLAITGNAGPRLFRDRVLIRAPHGAQTIVSYLTAVLGRELRVSMYVSGARANRKPVLQLVTPRGEAVGFAKIGIDPLTCRLVRAESEALDLVAATRPRSFAVARVLHHGTWNGLEVLVLAALPVWARRRPVSRSRLLDAMREVAGIAGMSREPFTAAPQWRRLQDRLSSAPAGEECAALQSAMRTLADQGGKTTLSYGSWHGDWSPWNMASTRTTLLVWDWERFSTGVPVGFDALHHWVQTELGRGQRAPATVVSELADRAAGLLSVFGIGGQQARLTALLYLAELASRDLVDGQEDAGSWVGGPGRWLIPAIASELARA